MKRIAVLGSTGSIGKSTLAVASHLKDTINVVALAAHSNIDLLEQQALAFSPKVIAVFDKDKARELQQRLPQFIVLGGMEGLCELAAHPDVDFVVAAITGTAGLLPTLAAIRAKKNIGLANKEVLVAAGDLVTTLVKENGVDLLPIDSEHSALFQCLRGEDPKSVKRLVLTASGGPFRTFTQQELERVSLEQALKHPTWTMGAKVTIDSSTLMNKGLEMIEARWLFDKHPDEISIVVHPQSIIHSMVEYVDGSIIAQMGVTDMQLPIQYAMTFPERVSAPLPSYNFFSQPVLEFFEPDFDKFTCLRLAYESIKIAGTMPCYMNAANEVLVERFLRKELAWADISRKLEHLMQKHQVQSGTNIETILAVDSTAREEAQRI